MSTQIQKIDSETGTREKERERARKCPDILSILMFLKQILSFRHMNKKKAYEVLEKN